MKLSCLFLPLLAFISAPAVQAQSAYLDTSFNSTGMRSLPLDSNHSVFKAVALQPDGKIVLGGYASKPWSDLNFALTRLHPDGRSDSSFGTNGVVTTRLGTGYDGIHALKVDASGRIVVCGAVDVLGRWRWAIGRYQADGRPDSTFSDDGIYISGSRLLGEARDVELQPDGKILVCGSGGDTGINALVLLRMLPDGTPDATFGTGGLAQTSVYQYGRAGAITLQPDGKIIAAGGGILVNGINSYSVFVLARYLADGSPDGSFGQNGLVSLQSGATDVDGFNVILQPDSRILMTGYTYVPGPMHHIVLARYLPDGRPDTAFGTNGVVRDLSGGNAMTASSLLLPDGRIVVGGARKDTANYMWTLFRYLPDGRPDTSLDGTGRLVAPVTTYDRVGIEGLALQPDGRIVAAGSWMTYNGTREDAGLMRYLQAPALRLPDLPNNRIDLKAYPNPAGDQVTLQFSLVRPGPVTILLRDAAGRLVQTYATGTDLAPGAHRQPLHLQPGLPAGIYYLTLSAAEGSSIIRIVKGGR